MTGKASRRGKALQKDRYDSLKAAGLCVICKKKTTKGIRCEECKAVRKKQAQFYRLKKKLNQKAASNKQPPNGFTDFH